MKWQLFFNLILFSSFTACFHTDGQGFNSSKKSSEIHVSDSNTNKLILAAIEQTKKKVTYDGSYFKIGYPNGDIPDSLGVCTDVIIRAYRKLGIDLQKLVHEDMQKAWTFYNKRRKSDRIDANIDHRRVPNLMTYFERKGAKLAISQKPEDYLAGDIVCWDVAAGHIGLVIHKTSAVDSNRLLIVHNIGSGPEMEDYLFRATITGHYRYMPWKK